MACDFTFKHYEEILKLALKQGYRFLFFQENPDKYKKIIYLRHDIDISSDNAIKFAKIENKHEIKAVYFYLVHDIFYNILEKRVFKDIKDISRLGHQIGLHFDEDFFVGKNSNSKNTKEKIIQDLKLMENVLGIKISIVSFHNPKIAFIKKIKSKRFINVYSDKYFNKIKYLSDSLQNWKEGCLCKILKEEKYNKIQVLVHPFCWNKESLSISQVAKNYIFQKCFEKNEYLRSCSKIYQCKKISKNQCPFYYK